MHIDESIQLCATLLELSAGGHHKRTLRADGILTTTRLHEILLWRKGKIRREQSAGTRAHRELSG